MLAVKSGGGATPAVTPSGAILRSAAKAGESLTIFGANLGLVNRVWFGSVPTTNLSATETQVVVVVPADAQSGSVEIESGGDRLSVGVLAILGTVSGLLISNPDNDPLVVKTEVARRLYSIGTSSALPGIIVTSGNIYSSPQSYDFTVRFPWNGEEWPATDSYIVQIASTDGECSLRVQGGTTGIIMPKVRGADTTLGFTLFRVEIGDEIEVRYAYDAQGGAEQILVVRVNGAMYCQQTTQPGVVGPGFSTPTAVYLGSKSDGTLPLPAPVTYFQSAGRSHNPHDAEFAVIGDSTSASSADWKMTASAIYTAEERWARAGILSVAGGGNTIANQTTTWDGACAFYHGNANLKAFLIMVGVNDIILSGHDAATVTADLQAFVNHLKSTNPAAKIVLAQISPAGSYFSDPQRAIWATVNANIAGTGGTPITGVDAVMTDHVAILSDGSANNNLRPEYGYGDGLHLNNAGRDVVASEYRKALASLGLI